MADEIIKDAAAVLDAFTAIVSRLRSIEELACEVQSPYPFVTSRLGRLVGLVADQLAQACRDLDRYVDVTEYYCAHLERALDAHAGERLAPPPAPPLDGTPQIPDTLAGLLETLE